jgi:hypothetical protein
MSATVLDSTCSTAVKGRYPEKADWRMDVRREVMPDLVASACFLPFRDGAFGTIYCDPPHRIRKDGDAYLQHHPEKRERFDFFWRHSLRFGSWKTVADWHGFLSQVDAEFERCLARGGTLEFKVTDGAAKSVTKLSDLRLLTRFVEVGRRSQPSRSINSKNTTYFLTLKPVRDVR